MKAAVIHEHGGPGSIQYKTDYPDPVPGAGEALVRVRACTLNYHDIFTRRGMPGIKVPMPAIMGLDFAGEIVALGPDVRDWKIGERVMIDPVDRVGPGGLVGEVRPGGLAGALRGADAPPRAAARRGELRGRGLPARRLRHGDPHDVHHRPDPAEGPHPRPRRLGRGGHRAVLLSKLAGAEVIACASSPAKLQRLKRS